MLPSLLVLDKTTGTRIPEAVEAVTDEEAAAELSALVLEAATWRVAVAEVSMVLPAELVVVMATTVGLTELSDEAAVELSAEEASAELSAAEEAAAELSEEATEEASVEGAADEDATTDELRPAEETALEEGDWDETDEVSEDWEI